MKRILIIGFIGVLSLLVLTGCSSGYNKSFFDTNLRGF